MKVLFVHYGDDRIAGSEVALLEMLRAFPSVGVEPTVWCNAPSMLAAVKALGVPAQIDQLAFYLDYGSPAVSPRRYYAMVRKAVSLIAETGAELVHCNSAAPAQWMRLACWRTKVPMLVNLHGPYLRRSRYVLGLHFADRLVTVSAAIAAPLLADGVDPDRIGVVYNGFDEAALLRGEARGLRAQLGIPADAVVGAIVGTLLHLKGHDLLFEAMRQLPELSHPFHLLVIGDGPEESNLRMLARNLPVHFLGRRDDVAPILRDAADFLVAPSRKEGFGRVVIEAALAGRPTIGARVDGLPEAISEGVTGLLAPRESPVALAEAIARFVEHPALRRAMGDAAQVRARAEFSLARGVQQMLAEYHTMLAHHRLRRPGRFGPFRTLIRNGYRRYIQFPAMLWTEQILIWWSLALGV